MDSLFKSILKMSWQVEIKESGVELFKLIDGGGPIIKEKPDGSFDLFEVPQYGGEEIFYENYKSLIDAIKIAEHFN